jgi:hypothetical protein
MFSLDIYGTDPSKWMVSIYNILYLVLEEYPSSNIVRVVSSRWMRWAGRAAIYRRGEKYIQNFSQNLKGRDHVGNLGIDGSIILKWIL